MIDQNILILSPSLSFSNQTEKVMRRMGYQFKILQAAGQEAIDGVQGLLFHMDIKAIVTRGYNVKVLRKQFAVPVVDVRYTFEDIYYSFEAASQLSDRIAFVAVDTALREIETFQMITQKEMLIPKLTSLQQIPGCVRELAGQGVEVFIGGQTTERAAREMGIRSIDIFVDEKSLETAIGEAVHLTNLEKEREKNQSFIESVLETADSAMVAVAADSRLLYKNEKAVDYFGGSLAEFINAVLSRFVADYRQHENDLLNQVVEFQREKFIMNFSAITASSGIEGYLASVERLEVLQAKEGDVRTKLSQKANAARKGFGDLVGGSAALQDTIRQAEKFSRTNSAVLINGETGTGKEVFAQGIHNASLRRDEPFIAINCASLSENVLESELFGYVKGAFTGAMMNGKIGLFEAAHKGTIFLDEIGDVSLNFQAKLLRVLQEKEITRIGDTKSIPVDVRIISATNRNLVEMVEQKEFREDLYYRLCVLHLFLPPLRQRREDIEQLVAHMLERSQSPVKISQSARELLTAYDFPGNVRQLQNIVERLVALCENSRIDHRLVRSVLEKEPQLSGGGTGPKGSLSISEGEKEMIRRALRKYNNNKTLAAEELKIGKSTLWRKMKLYDLQ